MLTFNISAHHSWWSEHGPGCVRSEMPQAPGVRTTESQSYITVMGCLLDYQYIEVAHSGAQILVAVSMFFNVKCKYIHVWTCHRNWSYFTLNSGSHLPHTGIRCVWRVTMIDKTVKLVFPSKYFSQHKQSVIWSVAGSLPLPQMLNKKIDLLSCLAENQTHQLVTGYSNTGRTVIVLFVLLSMNTKETQILPLIHICTHTCITDSPDVGWGPGPTFQHSRHFSSDLNSPDIYSQWYYTHTHKRCM